MSSAQHERTVERVQPALDEYSEARGRHFLTSYESDDGSCRCGWTPPATSRRPRASLGLHLRAAQRKADAEFDARVKELLRRPRKGSAR